MVIIEIYENDIYHSKVVFSFSLVVMERREINVGFPAKMYVTETNKLNQHNRTVNKETHTIYHQ